jgi:hypothetical protein
MKSSYLSTTVGKQDCKVHVLDDTQPTVYLEQAITYLCHNNSSYHIDWRIRIEMEEGRKSRSRNQDQIKTTQGPRDRSSPQCQIAAGMDGRFDDRFAHAARCTAANTSCKCIQMQQP